MKIEIKNDDIPESLRDTKFQRIVISFDAGGQRKTVVSKVITSNTDRRTLAETLCSLARALWPLGGEEDDTPATEPIVWADFMRAVHRADRFIATNAEWRKDFSAPPDPPVCPPTFEFCGWRVYKPR